MTTNNTGFSLDFNDTMGGSIADGTYECIITKAFEDVNKNGKELVNFHLIIRNDIQHQEHKNQFIFENRYPNGQTGKHYMPYFNTVGKAAGLQAGKTYKSMEELLNDYVGKPVKVEVKNETSEYQGKTYDNLNIKNWSKTDFPNVQHVHKQKDDKPTGGGQTYQNPLPPLEINDDDLPF